MAGLPRSGSTLLSAILNQRPDLFCSSSSSTPEVLSFIDNQLKNSESYLSGVYVNQTNSLRSNILKSAYNFSDKEFIIDKSRGWTLTQNYEKLKEILPYEPKVLVPFRPLEEIISSFLRLFDENPGNYIDQEMSISEFIPWSQYSNISDARVDVLLNYSGHLRYSMSSLYNAMTNENQENFHYVEYSSLIKNPSSTLENIENFLDIPKFEYDFSNIIAEKHNDKEVWGVENMHYVDKSIREKNNYNNLSDYAIKRCQLEDFWTAN
jgi:sulfotransferase